MADAAAASRSLMAGLRRSREQGTGPVFLAVRGGMARLVERLAGDLKDVDIRLGASVPSLDTLGTDRAVLTVPADAAAALVRPVSPAAAAELDSIEYASVVTVSLAYPADSIGIDMDGSGFLVPRVDGRLMTACTWTTAKFPPASAPKNLILRASAGRAGDDRAMGLDDPVLVERLHGELVEAMGIVDPPTASRVTRWPRSFPQYAPGHGARVDRIEAALAADAPGVVLAGAAYRGLGIASCIEQADRAARAVLADAVSEPAS